MSEAQPPWWEQRRVHALLIFCAMLPLLYPPIPPLIDLPGHMGRYAVELAQHNPGPLAQYYTFQWQVIGNIGIDLLVIPLSAIFGLEFAVKLLVLAIPAVSTLGVLLISREVHGRVAPSAVLSLPLLYGYHFIFGFVNYALSMALMLVAYGLWLRLTRLGHLRLRAGLFLIISPLLWLTHVFGWATLCVLVGITELFHQYERYRRWLPTIGQAILRCLPMSPPLVMMLAWRSNNSGGATSPWEGWHQKLGWVMYALRDRWLTFDLISIALILSLTAMFFVLVPFENSKLRYSPFLTVGGASLLALFLGIPHQVFGSYFADMRLFPFALIVLILAIGTRPGPVPAVQKALALICLLLLIARTVATTWSFAIASHEYERALASLAHVPEGAKMVSFVGSACNHDEGMSKLTHLPAMAIVRKRAFSNDQWQIPGAQMLRTIYPQGSSLVRSFGSDPSSSVTNGACPGNPKRSINWSLANLPRDKFDYVLLIDPPPHDARLLRGMTPIWSDAPDALYRIENHRPLDQIPLPTAAENRERMQGGEVKL